MSNPAEAVMAAAQHLMQMFAAVCAAPEDTAVIEAANAALRKLEGLLTAG